MISLYCCKKIFRVKHIPSTWINSHWELCSLSVLTAGAYYKIEPSRGWVGRWAIKWEAQFISWALRFLSPSLLDVFYLGVHKGLPFKSCSKTPPSYSTLANPPAPAKRWYCKRNTECKDTISEKQINPDLWKTSLCHSFSPLIIGVPYLLKGPPEYHPCCKHIPSSSRSPQSV